LAKDKKSKKHASHSKRTKKVDNKQYILGAVVIVVLVAVVAGLLWASYRSGSERVSAQSEGVAAFVDGTPIEIAYIDDQYSRVPEQYKEFVKKSDLLNQTINEFVVIGKAESMGIEVTTEEVEAEVLAAMESSGMSEEDLIERLAEQGLSRDDLVGIYTKQLTINKLLEKDVFSQIDISDEEIEDFYDSRIRAMHVLVETEEEAEEIITDLMRFSLEEIEDGFSDIATASSTDPSAASNGGDLGEFGRGQMVPPFEEAAFSLEEYSFTAEPIQTDFGYHVILKLPKEKSFDEQYDEIKDALLTQKKASAVPDYVAKLRSEADIEILYKEEGSEALV